MCIRDSFSHNPSYVAFGSTGYKDTLRNIEENHEFVVNLAVHDFREAMNQTSARVDQDEFEVAGLAKAECVKVKPPRVAASPIALECRHFQTLDLPDDAGEVNNYLVV